MARKLNGIPQATQRESRRLRNMVSVRMTRVSPTRPFLVRRSRRLCRISRKALDILNSTPAFLALKSSMYFRAKMVMASRSSSGSFSTRMETVGLPFNQDLLEVSANFFFTSATSLILRNPPSAWPRMMMFPILLGSVLRDLRRISNSSSSDFICPPEISWLFLCIAWEISSKVIL